MYHLFNVFLGQPALVIGDCDLVPLTGGLVLGRHIQNAISINVKAHVDLRNTPGRWRNSR
uniref:Heat shock protein 70 cognate n=1 Tax=Rhizophora mucronata TaxID=61149 RepID=A0A2P2NQK1_RHIMU